jgi:hypothetical protein
MHGGSTFTGYSSAGAAKRAIVISIRGRVFVPSQRLRLFYAQLHTPPAPVCMYWEKKGTTYISKMEEKKTTSA